MTKLLLGHRNFRWHAPPIPDSPAPTTMTSTCSTARETTRAPRQCQQQLPTCNQYALNREQATVGAALCGHPWLPHCVFKQGRPQRAAPTVAVNNTCRSGYNASMTLFDLLILLIVA